MTKSTCGFGHILIVVGILVLMTLFGGGYVLWQKFGDNEKHLSPAPTPSVAGGLATKRDVPSGWVTQHSVICNLTYSYPVKDTSIDSWYWQALEENEEDHGIGLFDHVISVDYMPAPNFQGESSKYVLISCNENKGHLSTLQATEQIEQKLNYMLDDPAGGTMSLQYQSKWGRNIEKVQYPCNGCYVSADPHYFFPLQLMCTLLFHRLFLLMPRYNAFLILFSFSINIDSPLYFRVLFVS